MLEECFIVGTPYKIVFPLPSSWQKSGSPVGIALYFAVRFLLWRWSRKPNILSLQDAVGKERNHTDSSLSRSATPRTPTTRKQRNKSNRMHRITHFFRLYKRFYFTSSSPVRFIPGEKTPVSIEYKTGCFDSRYWNRRKYNPLSLPGIEPMYLDPPTSRWIHYTQYAMRMQVACSVLGYNMAVILVYSFYLLTFL